MAFESFFEPPFVEMLDNGNFAIRLSDEERTLLAGLPAQLKDQIQDGDDTSTIRLFPPAYKDDFGKQVEYDRLMRDDLQASHLGALEVLSSTIDEEEIDVEQLSSWVRAINSLRLVLGTNLDITEDDSFEELEPGDERAPAWSLYVYLGYLQEQAVEALTDSL